jgi:hypothetical protein
MIEANYKLKTPLLCLQYAVLDFREHLTIKSLWPTTIFEGVISPFDLEYFIKKFVYT